MRPILKEAASRAGHEPGRNPSAYRARATVPSLATMTPRARALPNPLAACHRFPTTFARAWPPDDSAGARRSRSPAGVATILQQHQDISPCFFRLLPGTRRCRSVSSPAVLKAGARADAGREAGGPGGLRPGAQVFQFTLRCWGTLRADWYSNWRNHRATTFISTTSLASGLKRCSVTQEKPDLIVGNIIQAGTPPA